MGIPQERHPELIPEQIVDSEMLDIPQEAINDDRSDWSRAEHSVSKVLGISAGAKFGARLVELPSVRGIASGANFLERPGLPTSQGGFVGVPGDRVPSLRRLMVQSSAL